MIYRYNRVIVLRSNYWWCVYRQCWESPKHSISLCHKLLVNKKDFIVQRQRQHTLER